MGQVAGACSVLATGRAASGDIAYASVEDILAVDDLYTMDVTIKHWRGTKTLRWRMRALSLEEEARINNGSFIRGLRAGARMGASSLFCLGTLRVSVVATLRKKTVAPPPNESELAAMIAYDLATMGRLVDFIWLLSRVSKQEIERLWFGAANAGHGA